MGSNTNLSRLLAIELIRGQKVMCPACGKGELASRYRCKNTRTEFKCPVCGGIFHAEKLI